MLDAYEEELRKRRRDQESSAVGEAARSAGLWGGLGGAAYQLVNGNRSIPSVLLRGLGSAAIAAPAAAGATAIGNALLGSPKSDDPAAYTTRGALGGGLGGALLGSGVGYLLGSGRLRGLAHLPFAEKAAESVKKVLPIDNLITDRLRSWASMGSHANGLKSAGLLGGALGGFGAMTGSSEGMGVDAIRNLQQRDQDQPAPFDPAVDEELRRYAARTR